MDYNDNIFFEEYKSLDKLCSEIFSCQNGVSTYISQMENNAYQGQYRVPLWKTDYQMLKHIRWVRNQIAHDSASLQISESKDLEFVRDFYSRIFSCQDPLTLLRKIIEAETKRRRKQYIVQKTNEVHLPEISNANKSDNTHKPAKKKSHGLKKALIVIGIVILIIITLLLLLNK